ncbi:MAG: hypothetical protein ACK5JU_00075 [Bacteroidales bacterium]
MLYWTATINGSVSSAWCRRVQRDLLPCTRQLTAVYTAKQINPVCLVKGKARIGK